MKYLSLALLLSLSGCAFFEGLSGKATVPGDVLWQAADNEGGYPNVIREEGDEVWFEWWAGGYKPFARAKGSLADWKRSSTGTVIVSIDYDFSSGATGMYVR